MATAGAALLLGEVCNEAFGGEHESGDGGGVLQGRAGDLGGVDHAGGKEILVGIGDDVVAHGGRLQPLDLFDDEGGFAAGVFDELAKRSFYSTVDDGGTGGFIAGEVEGANGLLGADESHATTGHDAFFHRSTGGVQGVVHAVFLLLHFGFCGSTDLDDGHTASELGEALLEFLAVIVGGGVLNLLADLGDSGRDVGGGTGPLDDDGGILGDNDALGHAELVYLYVFELEAEVLGDALTTGEDGDILEHGLAAIAKAGGLDGADVEGTAETVHHEGGEGFTLDILGDDEEGLAGLGHFFEDGEEILEVGNLLLEDEDVGAFEHGFHGIGVGDEVGGSLGSLP